MVVFIPRGPAEPEHQKEVDDRDPQVQDEQHPLDDPQPAAGEENPQRAAEDDQRDEQKRRREVGGDDPARQAARERRQDPQVKDRLHQKQEQPAPQRHAPGPEDRTRRFSVW